MFSSLKLWNLVVKLVESIRLSKVNNLESPNIFFKEFMLHLSIFFFYVRKNLASCKVMWPLISLFLWRRFKEMNNLSISLLGAYLWSSFKHTIDRKYSVHDINKEGYCSNSPRYRVSIDVNHAYKKLLVI
jgi:hypothetical protein